MRKSIRSWLKGGFLQALAGPVLLAAAADPALLLVKNGLLLTMKESERAPFIGYLVVGTDGKIREVGRGDPPANLEPGKFADFLVINPRDRDTGPVHDPYATLVLACSQANLEQVYIGGKLVSQRGKIMSQDFERVADEVHRRAESIKARVDAELAQKAAGKKMPGF